MGKHGPRLTPAEIALAAATYHATDSYAEASRAIGREDPSVARKALLRLGNPSQSQAHARACARGLRIGRKRLVSAVDKIGKLLATELDAGSMEPKNIASLGRALSSLSQAVTRIDERRDSADTERLRRTKIRREVAALDRAGGLTVDALVEAINGLSRDDKTKLRDALKAASPSASAASDSEAPHDAG